MTGAGDSAATGEHPSDVTASKSFLSYSHFIHIFLPYHHCPANIQPPWELRKIDNMPFLWTMMTVYNKHPYIPNLYQNKSEPPCVMLFVKCHCFEPSDAMVSKFPGECPNIFLPLFTLCLTVWRDSRHNSCKHRTARQWPDIYYLLIYGGVDMHLRRCR